MEELCQLNSHPTANDLYENVRKRLPRISLGTIYRNLEILSEVGLINKLETAGTQKRFDGVTKNHYHIRCLECGRVDDVGLAPIESINDTIQQATDYKVLWHSLEFVGLCPRCKVAA